MKIAIIGGSGKMGRWFADFLLKDGKEVVISGRNEGKLLDVKRQLGIEVAPAMEAVKGADVVLLSVPVENLEGVVEQVSPHIQDSQIIIDVTSTKVFPVEIMKKHLKTGQVLGAHPVFGPGARSLANQNIILTPTNDEEQALAEKVRAYLETKKANVSLMTPQEHDEMMTIILGLSHFIAIVAADTLVSSKKLKQIEAVGGITYRVLLTLIESVVSEDPELYASLQMNLPNITEVERLFQTRAKEWADLVADKDSRKFVQQMKDLKNSVERSAPDFGKAYENMYKIADGL